MDAEEVYVYNPFQGIEIGRRTGISIHKVKNVKNGMDNIDDYFTDSEADQTLDVTQQVPLTSVENTKVSPHKNVKDVVLAPAQTGTTKRGGAVKNVKQPTTARKSEGAPSKSPAMEVPVNPFDWNPRVGRRTGRDLLAGKNVSRVENFSQLQSDNESTMSPQLTPETSSIKNSLRSGSPGETNQPNASTLHNSGSVHHSDSLSSKVHRRMEERASSNSGKTSSAKKKVLDSGSGELASSGSDTETRKEVKATTGRRKSMRKNHALPASHDDEEGKSSPADSQEDKDQGSHVDRRRSVRKNQALSVSHDDEEGKSSATDSQEDTDQGSHVDRRRSRRKNQALSVSHDDEEGKSSATDSQGDTDQGSHVDRKRSRRKNQVSPVSHDDQGGKNSPHVDQDPNQGGGHGGKLDSSRKQSKITNDVGQKRTELDKRPHSEHLGTEQTEDLNLSRKGTLRKGLKKLQEKSPSEERKTGSSSDSSEKLSKSANVSLKQLKESSGRDSSACGADPPLEQAVAELSKNLNKSQNEGVRKSLKKVKIIAAGDNVETILHLSRIKPSPQKRTGNNSDRDDDTEHGATASAETEPPESKDGSTSGDSSTLFKRPPSSGGEESEGLTENGGKTKSSRGASKVRGLNTSSKVNVSLKSKPSAVGESEVVMKREKSVQSASQSGRKTDGSGKDQMSSREDGSTAVSQEISGLGGSLLSRPGRSLLDKSKDTTTTATLNFGGDVTGSVTNAEKASASHFFGIKKRLSYSVAIADASKNKTDRSQNDIEKKKSAIPVRTRANLSQSQQDKTLLSTFESFTFVDVGGQDNFVIVEAGDEEERNDATERSKTKETRKRKSSSNTLDQGASSPSPPKLSKTDLLALGYSAEKIATLAADEESAKGKRKGKGKAVQTRSAAKNDGQKEKDMVVISAGQDSESVRSEPNTDISPKRSGGRAKLKDKKPSQTKPSQTDRKSSESSDESAELPADLDTRKKATKRSSRKRKQEAEENVPSTRAASKREKDSREVSEVTLSSSKMLTLSRTVTSKDISSRGRVRKKAASKEYPFSKTSGPSKEEETDDEIILGGFKKGSGLEKENSIKRKRVQSQPKLTRAVSKSKKVRQSKRRQAAPLNKQLRKRKRNVDANTSAGPEEQECLQTNVAGEISEVCEEAEVSLAEDEKSPVKPPQSDTKSCDPPAEVQDEEKVPGNPTTGSRTRTKSSTTKEVEGSRTKAKPSTKELGGRSAKTKSSSTKELESSCSRSKSCTKKELERQVGTSGPRRSLAAVLEDSVSASDDGDKEKEVEEENAQDLAGEGAESTEGEAERLLGVSETKPEKSKRLSTSKRGKKEKEVTDQPRKSLSRKPRHSQKHVPASATPQRVNLLLSLPSVTPQSGPSFRLSRRFSPQLSSPDLDSSPESPSPRVETPGPLARNTKMAIPAVDATPQAPASCLRGNNPHKRSLKGRKVRISNIIDRLEVSQNESNEGELSSDGRSSTMLPSPTSSPVHYAETTHHYPSPKDFLVPDLSNKIIRPGSENDDGLRRSHRTRVRRLSAHKGEGIIYRRDSTGFGMMVAGIQPSVVEAKERAREDKRRKQIKQRKMKALSVPAHGPKKRLSCHYKTDKDVTLTTEVAVLDPDTEEQKMMDLVARKDQREWYDSDLAPLTGSGPIAFGLQLQQANFFTGELQLGPLAEKIYSRVVQTVVFHIVHGKFCLTVNDVSTVVETDDDFFVPRGSNYSIKNLRRDVGRIHFINFNEIVGDTDADEENR
ncbi:serine/arginine repetitive matrix protein 2 isoform X1 [Aplysia californica]|uniref:Serine/arginine repetitive matrix protein 2 isoform X1 n=1 Tax=Aplysia californica TaxID=6500 RepID=A0ABM1ABM8_APLCA|nr:serine/arginine repetitive matrix protein 2 isoform X1 [Aplysia californica]